MISSERYNGGFLPDRHHTVYPMLLPSGNPIKCPFCLCSLYSHLNILTIFPLSERHACMSSDFSSNDYYCPPVCCRRCRRSLELKIYIMTTRFFRTTVVVNESRNPWMKKLGLYLYCMLDRKKKPTRTYLSGPRSLMHTGSRQPSSASCRRPL